MLPMLDNGDAVMLLPEASLLGQHLTPGTHALSNGVVLAMSMTTCVYPGFILKGKHKVWLLGRVYVWLAVRSVTMLAPCGR